MEFPFFKRIIMQLCILYSTYLYSVSIYTRSENFMLQTWRFYMSREIIKNIKNFINSSFIFTMITAEKC